MPDNNSNKSERTSPNHDLSDFSTDDIEAVSNLFEQRLRAGQPTGLDSIVADWEEPERSKLLYELLLIELRHLHSGDTSAAEDHYLHRFPDDADVVHEAVSACAVETVTFSEEEKELRTESAIQHLRFLAQGGLGQVFIGEDIALKREAAVKMIRNDLADNVKSCEQIVSSFN